MNKNNPKSALKTPENNIATRCSQNMFTPRRCIVAALKSFLYVTIKITVATTTTLLMGCAQLLNCAFPR